MTLPDNEDQLAPGGDKADQLWLLPRQGTERTDLVADVAIDARVHRLYSYGVPKELIERVRPGVTVRVPFGRADRLVDGLCVGVTSGEWDHTKRPIADASQFGPILDDSLIKLGMWISDYYVCPPGQAFAAMVPLQVRQPRMRTVVYLQRTSDEPAKPLTDRQQRLYDALEDGSVTRSGALEAAGVSPATIQSLRKRGLVEVIKRKEPRAPDELVPVSDDGPPTSPEDALQLTPGQEAARAEIAAAALSADEFRVFLLFGVPGSGKTEVYVRVIRDVIAAGRQAILIVPEIALATQVVERLARRFSRVAILHSQLTPRVRVETQRAITAGAVDVVIGTRTAVFAPCPRLGLIVVDEEQETSLKNLGAPFFHARDVAIKRGQIQNVPVVLGSATPALETWHNAQHLEHYLLLRLDERVPGARLPEVRLLQTPSARVGRDALLLAPPLVDELRDTLAAGQQAILLHNRRGYAVYLRCSRCEAVVRCPRCDSHLVLHQRKEAAEGESGAPPRRGALAGGEKGLLKCHQCGRTEPVRSTCADSSCGGRLERGGVAIQRLEETLRKLMPAARLLRLDSDTMKNRESYASALHRFEQGDADIMLGTQMVAKGLDFPAVRLVGVIDADAALSLPDFRSGERVLQLLVQVVGRAGRKEGKSLALVQSQDVTAPAIRAAIRMDYEGFAERELESRRRLGYPPFARLARLVLLDERRSHARSAAEEVADILRKLAIRVDPHLRIGEPSACVVPRLREMYRYQVLVRGPRTDCIQRLLELARSEKKLRPRVKRLTIDMDAIDLL